MGLHAAPLVFELQLLRDLVEHLDAARLEHVPQLAQLVGVGLEIGERGEDLAGRDEAALAHLVEHVRPRRRLRRAAAQLLLQVRCASSGSAVSVIVTTGFGVCVTR